MDGRRIPWGSAAELDFAVARRVRDAGQLDDAAAMLRKLGCDYPDDDTVLGELGIVEHELGRYEDALGFLRRAQALDPSYEPWSVALFHTLCAVDRLHDALVEAKRFMQAYPPAPGYVRLVGELHERLRGEGLLHD